MTVAFNNMYLCPVKHTVEYNYVEIERPENNKECQSSMVSKTFRTIKWQFWIKTVGPGIRVMKVSTGRSPVISNRA